MRDFLHNLTNGIIISDIQITLGHVIYHHGYKYIYPVGYKNPGMM